MAFKKNPGHGNSVVRCQRCNGCMAFEKFYGENNYFFGWHCITCGEILDPVILLHRLSQDPSISIPGKQEEMVPLIRKYATEGTKRLVKGRQFSTFFKPRDLVPKIEKEET